MRSHTTACCFIILQVNYFQLLDFSLVIIRSKVVIVSPLHLAKLEVNVK